MMGCGTSKRTTVVPVGDSVGGDEDAVDISRRASKPPPLKGTDHSEDVGDNASKNSERKQSGAPQPLAFEVPLSEESIIRKHPPKRLQRLEDQQTNLSHELLDEKQEEAKQRRFQILSQRVQSAKRTRKRFLSDDENNQGDYVIETMNHENSTLEL